LRREKTFRARVVQSKWVEFPEAVTPRTF
jgi:hypothetical protein